MNTKNTVCQILPAAIAREELRLRASGEAEKLSRSVSRRTSCGEAYPEYREEVAADYGTVDELLFCQQCRAALERFGLWKLFGHVVFAEEIGLEKRDPQCFVELSGRLGAPLEACTLFDDSPDNCATAARAGMTAVGVYDGYYAARQEELKTVCARYIRSFEELLWK